MGKLKELEIRYQNQPVYAGQLLRGMVCFDLKEKTKLKDLTLWLEGQTKVSLPGGDVSDEKWLLRTQIDLSVYLSKFEYRLPSGFHQVPFGYPLPQHLPSSFGEKYGYVYYCCRLTVNGRSKTHKSFTVIGVEDLNWHPYAALPVNIKERAAVPFYAVFNKSAYDLGLIVQLERTGFVPGEEIRIKAEIINRSNRKVKRTAIELRQGILYKTPGGRQREFQKAIETVKRDGTAPGTVDQWEDAKITVPALPPSFLRGSEFFSLKYELILTVEPGICLTVPLIIGTIPYLPQRLNRGNIKALPWKQEEPEDQKNGFLQFYENNFNNNNVEKYPPGPMFIEEEEQPIYVKRGNSLQPEKSFIKIEEID